MSEKPNQSVIGCLNMSSCALLSPLVRTWEYFVYLLITVTIPIVGSKRRGVLLGPLEKTIQLLKSNYQCQDIRQFETFGHSFRLRPESVPKEWLKILP